MKVSLNPNRSLEIFSCKKSDYSRRCHRYSICILTQYVSFVQFQDKIKAKFSNDRFGLNKAINCLKLQSGISEDMILFASLKYFLCAGNPYQWQWQDGEDHPEERT